MINNEIIISIKSIVNSFLPDSRVLLFGSKVKAKDDNDSDYDLLVITKKNYSVTEKNKWNTQIHKALVTNLDAPVDIILHSEEEVDAYKNYFGHIVRYAIKEGVLL